MSAIYGVGVLDIGMKAGANAKTTTSQYKCCVISADNTAQVVATATAGLAVGVIQSYQSSSSEAVTVRMLGVAKVTCESSVTAGRPIVSGELGTVAELAISSTVVTVGTLKTIIGYARESGDTNTVISAIVIPSMYPAG